MQVIVLFSEDYASVYGGGGDWLPLPGFLEKQMLVFCSILDLNDETVYCLC